MASLKDVVFKLRDIERDMEVAWNDAFHSIRTDCNLEVSIYYILLEIIFKNIQPSDCPSLLIKRPFFFKPRCMVWSLEVYGEI